MAKKQSLVIKNNKKRNKLLIQVAVIVGVVILALVARGLWNKAHAKSSNNDNNRITNNDNQNKDKEKDKDKDKDKECRADNTRSVGAKKDNDKCCNTDEDKKSQDDTNCTPVTPVDPPPVIPPTVTPVVPTTVPTTETEPVKVETTLPATGSDNE